MASESSQELGKGGAAVLTLLRQLWKNVETLPGWVPLVFCYQVAVTRAPENVTYLGIPVRPYLELFVGVLTFLSYQIGDAIDKPIFKDFENSRLEEVLPYAKKPREDLQGVLGISAGVYSVAISLLTAGGKYNGSFAHFFNEVAKLFRSAAIPLLLLPLLPVFVPSIPLLWRIIIAIVVFVAYVLLKPFHMRRLYTKTYKMLEVDKPNTPTASKYACRDLDDKARKMRLFFWDGRLVASAQVDSTANEQSGRSVTSCA